MLFGAVSVSEEYSPLSRSLIAVYLAERASHELPGLVRPRRKFTADTSVRPQVKGTRLRFRRYRRCLASIADIERDGEGVLVLIRQYLRVGGRVLGFTVDPRFGKTLDAVMLADLRQVPKALLERCMGREKTGGWKD